MDRMKGVGRSISLAGLVALLSSCYPGEVSSIGEPDLIATGARPGYAFSKRTYFMPDTVVYVQSDSLAPDTFSHAFDDDILAAVRTGLSAYGYTELAEQSDPAAADLLVLNAITVNVAVSPWTWGSGSFPPYWACCSGRYGWWPVPGSMVWRSGSVVTLMKDPDLALQADDAGDVWSAALNGLAGGSAATSRPAIASGIAQAFAQSPYLAGGS